MHRRIGADLLPLDTELEKTLRNFKKEKATTTASNMVEQGEANQNIPVAVERPQQRQRTMEDLWRPIIRDVLYCQATYNIRKQL